MKKTIKILTKIISFFLFFIIGLYCAFCIFVEGTLPQFQTFYITYNSFYKTVNDPTFMPDLPKSASHKRYYHHIYPFNIKDGYGFIVAEEEYETTKTQCLQNKWDYTYKLLSHKTIDGENIECTDEEIEETLSYWNIYSMNDTSKTEPDIVDTLEKYDADFFHKIAREKIDSGNYHFIWCYEDDCSPHPQIHCAIYNDETREIIEISCIRSRLD